MHEYAIVQSLVREALKELEGRPITRVTSLRFRRGSAFSEDALRETFAATAVGTPLEGAELVVEVVNLNYRCPCGRESVVTSDDLHGHMYVCPECGAIKEIEEAHDIELLEMVAEEED